MIKSVLDHNFRHESLHNIPLDHTYIPVDPHQHAFSQSSTVRFLYIFLFATTYNSTIPSIPHRQHTK